MKLTETTINYLKSQLQEIDTFNRYAPTIVIRNGADATKTNHISLNTETATLLIIWLATKFELKTMGKQILHDVAYNIVHEMQQEEGEEWSITQRINRFNEITELFK